MPFGKKFHPVLVAKLAKRLYEDVPRSKIKKEFNKVYGVSIKQVGNYLRTFFSEKQINELLEKYDYKTVLNILLWKYRNQLKNKVDRSNIAKARDARLTPEQRSLRAQKAMQTIGPEGLKKRARLAAKNTDKVKLIEAIRRAHAKIPPEKRSESARIREAKKGADVRSKIAKNRESIMTDVAKKERAKNGLRSRYKGLYYIENLPDLNLLSNLEVKRYLKKYMSFFITNFARNDETGLIAKPLSFFEYSKVYDDLKQEYALGIIIALKKWDKKRDLDKLVYDSVILRYFEFFREISRYGRVVNQKIPFDHVERKKI